MAVRDGSRSEKGRRLTIMPESGMIMPILGSRPRSRRSPRKSLADALLTRTQQRVLGRLFGHPDRSFYASEVIRDAGTGSGAAQRELARLHESGLIVARRVGHQKHYQANDKSPLFTDLRNIVMKTVGLVEPLREALKPIASDIRIAFIYGSVAKATDRAASDVDLMVVSDTLTYGEVFAALEKASRALGRTVNPTVHSTAEFSRRTKSDSAFFARVLEGPKVWVIGAGDGLVIGA
jgi:predicted nucleotidyltransferase